MNGRHGFGLQWLIFVIGLHGLEFPLDAEEHIAWKTIVASQGTGDCCAQAATPCDCIGHFKCFVDQYKTHVGGISLDSCNITKLHPGFVKFTKVHFLSLAKNHISGTVPEWIGRLTGLQTLRLDFNRFTGAFPESLSELKDLEWFSAQGQSIEDQQLHRGCQPISTTKGKEKFACSQLTGPIPDLRNSVNLKTLDLAGNPLSAELPSWLGHLRHLEQISLDGCYGLEGPIPPTWRHLTKLRLIHMSQIDLGMSYQEVWSLLMFLNPDPSAWEDGPSKGASFRNCFLMTPMASTEKPGSAQAIRTVFGLPELVGEDETVSYKVGAKIGKGLNEVKKLFSFVGRPWMSNSQQQSPQQQAVESLHDKLSVAAAEMGSSTADPFSNPGEQVVSFQPQVQQVQYVPQVAEVTYGSNQAIMSDEGSFHRSHVPIAPHATVIGEVPAEQTRPRRPHHREERWEDEQQSRQERWEDERQSRQERWEDEQPSRQEELEEEDEEQPRQERWEDERQSRQGRWEDEQQSRQEEWEDEEQSDSYSPPRKRHHEPPRAHARAAREETLPSAESHRHVSLPQLDEMPEIPDELPTKGPPPPKMKSRVATDYRHLRPKEDTSKDQHQVEVHKHVKQAHYRSDDDNPRSEDPSPHSSYYARSRAGHPDPRKSPPTPSPTPRFVKRTSSLSPKQMPTAARKIVWTSKEEEEES